MKLIQFDNGKFGVRAHWFFGWRFYDLRNDGFFWPKSSIFFCDCMGSREKAENFISFKKMSYKVVE